MVCQRWHGTAYKPSFHPSMRSATHLSRTCLKNLLRKICAFVPQLTTVSFYYIPQHILVYPSTYHFITLYPSRTFLLSYYIPYFTTVLPYYIDILSSGFFFFRKDLADTIPLCIAKVLSPAQWLVLVHDHYKTITELTPDECKKKYLGRHRRFKKQWRKECVI